MDSRDILSFNRLASNVHCNWDTSDVDRDLLNLFVKEEMPPDFNGCPFYIL